MKKKILILFVVVLAFVIPVAANAATALLRRQIDPDYESEKPFLSKLDGKIADGEESISEKISVYLEKELLFRTNGQFYLGRDAYVYTNFNSCPNYLGGILEAYPTDAIRRTNEDSAYLVYETDTGYRLYLYSQGEEYMFTTSGFPVVVKEPHSYSEFRSLKVGDSMSAVEMIDSVTTLNRKVINEVWNLDPLGAANMAKNGFPCTTVHYLRDGILRIEYEMLEDRSLVISNMEYSDNYKLENSKGRTVDYRIKECDLPPSWAA